MDCYHHYNRIPEQSARGECTTSAVDPPLLAGAIQGASEVTDCVGSKEWIQPFGLLMYCLQKESGQLGSSNIRLSIPPWRHPGNSVGRYLGGILGVLHMCCPVPRRPFRSPDCSSSQALSSRHLVPL